jgi:predicted secreted protein
MKKFRITFTIIIFGLLAFSINYFNDNYNYYKPGENGGFRLRVGEEFSIKLYENPSTGHSNCWLNENAVSCIKKVGRNYISGLNSKLGYEGAGGDLKITFKATKKGVDTLKIGSCPLGIEGKTSKDYTTANCQTDNEFYIIVE